MSRESKMVVTLRVWHVDREPVEDADGDVDYPIVDEHYSDYTFPRRDYPRGPEGKAELIAALADAFKSEGVDFASTGNDWASLPDGSYTLNYRTGAQREVSVHFALGTPAWVIRDVMEAVG